MLSKKTEDFLKRIEMELKKSTDEANISTEDFNRFNSLREDLKKLKDRFREIEPLLSLVEINHAFNGFCKVLSL